MAWFQDSRSGVFAGIYGTHGGTHFSYHKSGEIHFKSKSGDLLHPPTRKVPLPEIDTFQNFAAHSIPFSRRLVAQYTDAFEPAIQDRIITMIGPGQVRGRGRLRN